MEIRLRLVFSLLPAWLFLIVSRFAPPWAAIGSGFLASLAFYYRTDRNRLLGGLSTLGLSILAIASVIGIVIESEKAYLAAGIVMDLVLAPVFAASGAIHRPLVGGISREMVPTIAGQLPLDHVVYRALSVAWGAYYLFHGLVQLWLLRELSVAQFVILSRAVLWPPTGLALLVTAAIVWRAAVRPGRIEDAGGQEGEMERQ